MRIACCHGWIILLTLTALAAQGQVANTYNFDDGQIPSGTAFPANAGLDGNAHNPGAGATNAAGFNNTGMLIMAVPASGSTFAQWQLPDFASGQSITNLSVTFNVFIGGGTNGNAAVRFPPAGGNGMVFHWGPGLLYQYAGSASSFGQGLDVTFRMYNSGANTPGINIYFGGTAGAGNNVPITASSFTDYYAGGVTNFSSNTRVSLNIAVTNTGAATNAILSLVCSNSWNGLTNIYSNLVITNFMAPMTNHTMAFTATDGAGAHEFCFLDNVDFTVNGNHIVSSNLVSAVVITNQPASQIAREGDSVWFAATASGTPPFTYQWQSNGVAIAGATAASYTPPAVVSGMNGTLYSVVVSNGIGGGVSSNATLRVLSSQSSLGRTLIWNDEFNGATIDTTKWQPQGDYARQQGYWYKNDSYLNGQGQLVLRVQKDPTTGNYGSGAVQTGNNFQRTFGYFEAKMKFPTQQGHWCAFWLFTMSEGNTNVIGGTDGAEIDILEKAWLTDHAQNALHWDGYSPNPFARSAGVQVYNLGLNDGGWHIVGLDWTPTNYYFYVDGTLTWSTNAGGVCRVPDYIMCTEEIGYFGTPGPNTWGTGPITNAALPDYAYFEYVRVYEAAPYITNQPQSQMVIAGGSASFTVGAAGTPPLTYQWRLNGTNLSGATGSSYTDSNAQPADAGSYTVVVADIAGSSTSSVATLTVPPAQFGVPALFNGSNLVLSWSGGGILESATNVTGPWVVVTNAGSPYTNVIDPNMPQQFFRVRQ